jgi:predicted SprT family Zn-dependent metalloprotease
MVNTLDGDHVDTPTRQQTHTYSCNCTKHEQQNRYIRNVL